jgi:hypothetical protein
MEFIELLFLVLQYDLVTKNWHLLSLTTKNKKNIQGRDLRGSIANSLIDVHSHTSEDINVCVYLECLPTLHQPQSLS